MARSGKRLRASAKTGTACVKLTPDETLAKSRGDRGTITTRMEIRDGMRVEWDVPIRMDDDLVLRADVFRPIAEGRYPVLLTYGPYAKGSPFRTAIPALGSGWSRSIRTWREARPTNIKTGKSSTPRNG